MKLNEITTDAVMALNPCCFYHREKVETLVQRLSTETPFEVLASIPVEDAFWFIAHALPKLERVQWVEACASRAKEYAEGVADARVAHWVDLAFSAATAAAYASRAAHYAARVANYAGGKAAQRAEQHLAIRHGVQLLEGAK